MPIATPNIARIREDQIDIAAGILARAFQLDPPMVYTLPDAAERARLLPSFMKTFVTYASMFGEPLTTAEKPEAVALWLPLDDLRETPERDRQAGIDQIPAIFGAEAFRRMMHIAETSGRFHQRSASGKHLYLMFLGVEPSRQGKAWAVRSLVRCWRALTLKVCPAISTRFSRGTSRSIKSTASKSRSRMSSQTAVCAVGDFSASRKGDSLSRTIGL